MTEEPQGIDDKADTDYIERIESLEPAQEHQEYQSLDQVFNVTTSNPTDHSLPEIIENDPHEGAEKATDTITDILSRRKNFSYAPWILLIAASVSLGIDFISKYQGEYVSRGEMLLPLGVWFSGLMLVILNKYCNQENQRAKKVGILFPVFTITAFACSAALFFI